MGDKVGVMALVLLGLAVCVTNTNLADDDNYTMVEWVEDQACETPEYACYEATPAPVEASSGEVVRHRLSLGGNRKLNYALHMVAVCQARPDA